ncbi:uncharacterized protein LOC117780028 [Drosophila innubila]|uniref:uncharacterized protein LOC117780028 n=1 Tax=Drosophila innubila TaxID=198719 RepID=UPI00148E7CF0|nr:uncharacterized protein LOC117780028 [Drosophila innubila]
MRIITLCLLVLASASCLLGNVQSSAPQSVGFEEVQPFGFGDILKTILTTVRGVNCTMKQVIEVMAATTRYIDAIDACGTAVPKDIAKIIKSCLNIYDICNDIIHLNSTICAHEEGAKMTGLKCTGELFLAIMKLTRNINVALKLMAKLPFDTEECFVDATRVVEASYKDFMPNVQLCVHDM